MPIQKFLGWAEYLHLHPRLGTHSKGCWSGRSVCADGSSRPSSWPGSAQQAACPSPNSSQLARPRTGRGQVWTGVDREHKASTDHRSSAPQHPFISIASSLPSRIDESPFLSILSAPIMFPRSIAQSSARAARSLALRSGSVRMVTPAVARRTLITATAQKSLAIAAHNMTTLPAQRNFSSSASRKEIVKVPQMAESITEGTLKQWNKKVGDFVQADEEVATIETDKIDVSVNAPQSGTIVEVFANEEDTVEVGKDLFKLEPGEAPAGGAKKEEKTEEKKEDKKEDKPKKEESKQQQQPEKKGDDKKPAPAAEPESRPSAANSTPPPSKPSSSSSSPSSKSSSSSGSSSSSSSSAPKPAAGSREENRVKMSRMRLRIAERLKQSQNTAASLTTFNEIDMTNLMAFRARHKDRILKEKGVKLGFMSAFAKASAMALKDVPAANASIEGAGLGDTIVYRDYVDLSVAVSTDKGLVTPVVRNLEGMSLIEIEEAIAGLGKKARDNKLTLEDMSGGTFTISNGGVFGSLFGTPILNLPGSAILGMHAVKDKAWVVNGKVEIRPIMVVALTYDHRLLDGREAVTFLVKLKQYIEDMPSMLL
ncbi:hypothetical protein PaG_02494 [Moesziomyces aphidis]|uniref:dihydrolipoyllysine-residue succinyltransferase n=1 Tax=Moesziomyces aphidis TaxID=84754 RepID=W3VMQ4_MOEAP|nr:hypothetical protein PaG_02494 [Moesziomyces aphidis]